jgi:hypothetical protein
MGGNRRTLLSGLPSGINDVGDPAGPAGLFMRGRTLYVAIGGGDAVLPGPVLGTVIANPDPSSPIFSSLLALHFSTNAEASATSFALTFADHQALAQGTKLSLSNGAGDNMTVELIANFPDYTPKPIPVLATNVGASNPFGLLAVGDRLFVTDGGQNTVWRVDLTNGSFETLAEFASVPNPLFPFVGPPFEEAVPTGIAYVGGQLLVTLFTGVPFAQATSVVEQVNPLTGTHGALITGLTTAIGVLPLKGERANTDYLVLQHASAGPFFGGTGLLLRFASPASPGSLITNCLTRPTSMSLDANTGTLYVAELTGRIVAVRIAP